MFRRFFNFSIKNLEDYEKNKIISLLSINFDKKDFVVQSKNIYRLRTKVRSIMHLLRTFRDTNR